MGLLPQIKAALAELPGGLNQQLIEALGDFTALHTELATTLMEVTGYSSRGRRSPKFNEELDQLRRVTTHSANWLADLEGERERALHL